MSWEQFSGALNDGFQNKIYKKQKNKIIFTSLIGKHSHKAYDVVLSEMKYLEVFF